MRDTSLLLDLGHIDCDCTDHALEALHKAIADPPKGMAAFEPHENEFIRLTIETFTARGIKRLADACAGLLRAVGGIERLQKAWPIDVEQTAAAILRLQDKPQRLWSVDDWLLFTDWIIGQYLPPHVIRSEADYLTVRAAIAAKIRRELPDAQPGPDYDLRMPTSAAAASAQLRFVPMESAVLQVARARAAEAIVNLGDQARHRIKRVIIDNIGRRQTGDVTATVKQLEQEISDEFAYLNRDWRRIAITETGNAENEGVIAGLPPGSVVKRWEHYPTACPFCKKLHGMEFEVIDPANPDRDGWKHVWVGKTNVGRSASPRKRVDDELVERTEAELWWPAAGVQHPNCRGRWEVVRRAGEWTPDDATREFVDSLVKKHLGS